MRIISKDIKQLWLEEWYNSLCLDLKTNNNLKVNCTSKYWWKLIIIFNLKHLFCSQLQVSFLYLFSFFMLFLFYCKIPVIFSSHFFCLNYEFFFDYNIIMFFNCHGIKKKNGKNKHKKIYNIFVSISLIKILTRICSRLLFSLYKFIYIFFIIWMLLGALNVSRHLILKGSVDGYNWSRQRKSVESN